MGNHYNEIHIWEDDLKSTICGIPKEIVSPSYSNAVLQLCDDCTHIFANHVKYDPSPAEAEFIDFFLGSDA